MYDLEHGQYVSQSQIDAALFVPPKSLSAEQRADLIGELENARNQDEQGWWDWTRDPVIAQDFAVQEKKANRAIKRPRNQPADLMVGDPRRPAGTSIPLGPLESPHSGGCETRRETSASVNSRA